MTATGWALAIVVVAVFFGVMVAMVVVGILTGGARRGVPPARPEWRPDAPGQFTGAPPYPPSTPGYPSIAVLTLIGQGKKIQAIKQYRLETGAGLAEAKQAVEAFERGQPARPEWRPDAPGQFTGAPPYPPSTPAYPSAAVLALIAQGNKIGAIKQFRAETGAGLKEAKDAVEAFERGPR